MAKKKKLPKSRNPFVQHLIVKKQGAHQKSKKSERRKQNMTKWESVDKKEF